MTAKCSVDKGQMMNRLLLITTVHFYGKKWMIIETDEYDKMCIILSNK